jgi:hypothetical protein
MLGLINYEDSDEEEVTEDVNTNVSPQKYKRLRKQITTNVQAFRHSRRARRREPWTSRVVRITIAFDLERKSDAGKGQ